MHNHIIDPSGVSPTIQGEEILRLPDSPVLRGFLKEKLVEYERRIRESVGVTRHSQDARSKAVIIRLLLTLGQTDKKSVAEALAGQEVEMPAAVRIDSAWNVVVDYIHNGGRGVAQPVWCNIPVPQIFPPGE